ncbi:tripartite tricarboxylate transporter substrate binding protein BugD [Quisquiliibacterium transsilvanicum]|uniref:Tripartite-type tricarboxylate transporter receptor subunit TctC n=1 Tax=Quisquiliibacterium transsilvanicum TaxID=1549638 RepID=A0A7W8HGS7_9BURK|nr:tripartite tricarboxylate transporter substrate binding protein BugD [Quisquiliibacterium transsilvanicum]MBB5271789.1 tripartite-type tricarboxylate transporter receptor subunit TctC [Quisquiliibacterium transsilvanicum]
MMRSILAAALAAGFTLATVPASAQQFPSRPVTVVVPFAAGGPTDTVARSVAAGMEKALGQSVIVENKPGAGGTLGADNVAKAAPDGYRVLVWHIGMSTSPALYRRLSFDPLKDFEYVGLINDVPMTLLVRPSHPSKNLAELVTWAKANTDKATLANAGLGAASHLCGLMFQQAIGTQLVTVPYKGTAPALADLMGNQVDVLCDQTTNTTPQIKGGRVRALALTAPSRLASLPDVPTAAEAGLKGFELGIWHGMYAPKGTPKPVLDKLVSAMQAALASPEVKNRFAELGSVIYPVAQQTPEALQKHLKAEIDKWGPVIRKAGVYAD